jgi:hypothetical protein
MRPVVVGVAQGVFAKDKWGGQQGVFGKDTWRDGPLKGQTWKMLGGALKQASLERCIPELRGCRFARLGVGIALGFARVPLVPPSHPDWRRCYCMGGSHVPLVPPIHRLTPLLHRTPGRLVVQAAAVAQRRR